MKKTLNEEIARIKGMMGKIMTESFDETTNADLGETRHASENEMELEMDFDRVDDMMNEIFADDKISSNNTINDISDRIKALWPEKRKEYNFDIYGFVRDYMLDYAEEARSAYADAPGSSEGGQSKHHGDKLNGSIYDYSIEDTIIRATEHPEPNDDQIFNSHGMEGGIRY